jgi:hypothetical protein
VQKEDAVEQRPSVLIMKDQERRLKKLISLFSNSFDYLSREKARIAVYGYLYGACTLWSAW